MALSRRCRTDCGRTSSDPAGEAGTLSSLRALLDVAAVVRSRDDLQGLLEEMALMVRRRSASPP